MTETEQQPIKWEKGQNDLEYFGSLSFEELTEVLADEATAIYYASKVTYSQESRVYRPNPDSLSGEGFDVRPETKIIFTVGDGVNSNMRLAQDLEGNKVRTKKSDGRDAEAQAMMMLQFAHYKAAECDEVRATVSFFLDGENNVTADMAFAEISDIFYNLFHLETTDSANAAEYQHWEDILLKTLGMDKVQIIRMIAAKYHFRLFKNHGKNGFEQEDAVIKSVLHEIYGDLEEVYLKERASNFLTLADIMFDRVLKARLKKLKVEFAAKKLIKEIKLPQKIRTRIRKVLSGKFAKIARRLEKDTEQADSNYADSIVAMILARAAQYDNTEDKQEY